MKWRNILFLMLLILLVLQVPVLVSAADDAVEWSINNLEVEKLINLGGSLISLVLLALTFIAYKRTGNKRLIYVSLAFLLFAVKTFLVGAEVFFGEWPWVDPVASFMDFAILASFFLGVLKK